jgi:hypothetical protein
LSTPDGIFFSSIDDNEVHNLRILFNSIYGSDNFVIDFVWRKTDNQANIGNVANVKEYILCYAKDKSQLIFSKMKLSERAVKEYRYSDENGKFRRDILFHKTRGRHHFDVRSPSGKIISGPWMIKKEKFDELLASNRVYWSTGKEEQPYGKIYLKDSEGQITSDLLGINFGTNQQGSREIESLFGNRAFDFPKPITLIEHFCRIATDKKDIISDFFAGSGTTAHAVMKINSEDQGDRKFILIDMEKHFTEVIIPRVKKVAYSFNWKSGLPTDMSGAGSFFKYHELEQYEDSLENVVLKQSTLEMFNQNLDILLRYQLEEGIDENKSKNFLGVDTEKEFLDLSINVLNKDGTTKQQKVDLIETFNYFIGLEINQMKKISENNGDYYIITGKTDGDKTIVIWRDPKDLDKEKDRDFITKQLHDDNFKNIYVNSDCHIQGYKNIYDEMRKRLW